MAAKPPAKASSISTFFMVLMLGQEHKRPQIITRSSLYIQWLHVMRIWRNKHYSDFGIERLVRLTLALAMFVFPGIYVRDLFGRFGFIARKLSIEVYVILKLILPLALFRFNLTSSHFALWLSIIMAIETFFYATSLIFLSNEYARPVSFRRSLLLTFINYIELCLNYAVVYSFMYHHNHAFF